MPSPMTEAEALRALADALVADKFVASQGVCTDGTVKIGLGEWSDVPKEFRETVYVSNVGLCELIRAELTRCRAALAEAQKEEK